MTDTPSHIRKIDWAEKHLVKLEELVGDFANSHPYTVTRRVEGQRKKRAVWRLEFTSQPGPDLSLIVGDILYNMRSSLDHLAAALVKPSLRSKVMFPIFTEPVWELPHVEGENPERTKSRQRWETVTRAMQPEAVAIIKNAQPIEPRPNPDQLHPLTVLNRLSNKDRHSGFSLISWGLVPEPDCEVTFEDGSTRITEGTLGPYIGIQDGAEIGGIPPGVVKVDLKGTPLVVLQVEKSWGNIRVPTNLQKIAEAIRVLILEPCEPYLRG